MAIKRRTDRLNSLLREVLSDVIRNQVKNPDLATSLITITSVEIAKDLRNAKVLVSVIGNDEEKKKALRALISASGFISCTASKMVVMHHFPKLRFYLDESVEMQMRIHDVITKVQQERDSRDESEEEEARDEEVEGEERDEEVEGEEREVYDDV
ncbi:MAG: ribosome-binding factor A [Chlamydiales bacterium]|jgi:ribosome-binding factor A